MCEHTGYVTRAKSSGSVRTVGFQFLSFEDTVDAGGRLELLAKHSYRSIRRDSCVERVLSFPRRVSSMCATQYNISAPRSRVPEHRMHVPMSEKLNLDVL